MSPSNKSADEAINDALLEKLRTCVCKPQETDTFRHIASKIHARVTSSGNHVLRTFPSLLILPFVSPCKLSRLWKSKFRITNTLNAWDINHAWRCQSFFFFVFPYQVEHWKQFLCSFIGRKARYVCGGKVLNEPKQIGHFKTGSCLLNCYFYRERWLLFHRANHQKLAQFIIRTVVGGACTVVHFVSSRQHSTRFHPPSQPTFPFTSKRALLIPIRTNSSNGNVEPYVPRKKWVVFNMNTNHTRHYSPFDHAKKIAKFKSRSLSNSGHSRALNFTVKKYKKIMKPTKANETAAQ